MSISEKMNIQRKSLRAVLNEGFDIFLVETAQKDFKFYGKPSDAISREEVIKENGKVQDLKAMFITKLFDVTTYDGELDCEFGEIIIEVMKTIQKGKNFDYIKNKKKYRDYILVANLLDDNGWIEWGSSIRGAWFDAYGSAKFAGGVYYGLDGKFPIDSPNTGGSKNIDVLLEFLTDDKY